MSDAPRPIYAPIPARALADTRLSGTDLRLLAAIAAHDRFGKNGTGCFASQRRLAALIGAHEKAVARAAGRLVELGYTTSERSPTNGRLVIYRVVYTDDDAAAMRGDGRSFIKSTPLRLAPESGTGNGTATDSTPAAPVERGREAAGIGNRTATDQRPIGNSTKKKTERIQGAAPPNIFPERENRSGEALARNEFDRAAAPRPEPPTAARAEAGRSRDEVWDGASLDEQIAVLHRLHEDARPSPSLLENRLCRLARGAA